MKKINTFIALTLAILMSVGVAFATDQPNASASGNFNINTKAIGGGVDSDGVVVPGLGAAGGISGTGGATFGHAEGEVSTITYYTWEPNPDGSGLYYKYKNPLPGGIWNPKNYKEFKGHPENNSEWRLVKPEYIQVPHTYVGGTSEGTLITKGGGLTKTEAFTFNDGEFEGVGSKSENYAVTGAKLEVKATGIANAEGVVFGGMAQGSLNGSVVFAGSEWVSDGKTVGFAGQGAAGGFFGGAATGLYGSSTVEAGIESNGFSQSVSYRAVYDLGNGVIQEKLGTSVDANTTVTSFGNVNNNGFAIGNVHGGWVAGGAAGACTHQTAPGGVATASTFGSYSGSGNLGANYSGSLTGYAVTSAITQAGYNGSIMTSAASMKVVSGTPSN